MAARFIGIAAGRSWEEEEVVVVVVVVVVLGDEQKVCRMVRTIDPIKTERKKVKREEEAEGSQKELST